MKLPKNIKVSFKHFVLFVFILFSGLFLYLANEVSAQIPPSQTDCDKTSTEFHSLRPYQKSPCNPEPAELTAFCGNQLVLSDKVTVTQTIAPQFDPDCEEISEGKYKCKYDFSRRTPIDIDVSGASFPIVGNTEDVINIKNQNETIDDAEKVNEYISWYLNGTSYRAETAFPDVDSMSKIVDFAGPLRKLLPQTVQNEARIATVKKAGETRHDQIVACTYGVPIKFFNIFEVARIGQAPAPCYDSGLVGFIAQLTDIRDELRLSDWEKHLPPLEKEIGTKYEDFKDYWIAYKRWRGDSCAVFQVDKIIPVIGGKKISLCYDNPLKPNYWSNLFSYLPLSSTEDRVGLVSVESENVVPVSENVTVKNASLESEAAKLYFAHTEEASELASLLQSTYLPKGNDATGGPSGVSPAEYCDLSNIRTNSGDDLFAEEITGTLSYEAEFTCEFDEDETGNCTKDVAVGLSVISQTPKADDLWSKLVAGPAAIFKRIFPKVGKGSPILGILDIPGATKVSYSASNLVSVGNPSNERSNESAELYFPHIGSLQEYFLGCTQTALRPQGFGEKCESGELAAEGLSCSGEPADKLPDLPKASGSCSLSNADSGYKVIPDLPPTMVSIIEAAAETYKVPAGLLVGVLYGEGSFNRSWDWTEENVIKWSTGCAQMPSCNVNDPGGQGPYSFLAGWWDSVSDGVLAVDPFRTPNRCNFMDQTFAMAKALNRGKFGNPGYAPPQSCFGVSLNLGASTAGNSCSWSTEDVVTAIRQNAGRCFSASGTCAGGGGAEDGCEDDSCEKYSQCFGGGASCSSHSYCVIDVYQRYK